MRLAKPVLSSKSEARSKSLSTSQGIALTRARKDTYCRSLRSGKLVISLEMQSNAFNAPSWLIYNIKIQNWPLKEHKKTCYLMEADEMPFVKTILSKCALPSEWTVGRPYLPPPPRLLPPLLQGRPQENPADWHLPLKSAQSPQSVRKTTSHYRPADNGWC